MLGIALARCIRIGILQFIEPVGNVVTGYRSANHERKSGRLSVRSRNPIYLMPLDDLRDLISPPNKVIQRSGVGKDTTLSGEVGSLKGSL